MPPPSKERLRGAGEQPGGRQAGPPWCSWRVLAERNQSVAAVGAWVESALEQPQESLACASAFQVEEELKELQREKAASLRRFQGEVKQRVNQQVRMRRRQQLQKSYEAAERESCIATQYSDSALRLTPRKNTCLFRSHHAPAICGPGAHAVPAQRQWTPSEPFQQQAAQLVDYEGIYSPTRTPNMKSESQVTCESPLKTTHRRHLVLTRSESQKSLKTTVTTTYNVHLADSKSNSLSSCISSSTVTAYTVQGIQCGQGFYKRTKLSHVIEIENVSPPRKVRHVQHK